MVLRSLPAENGKSGNFGSLAYWGVRLLPQKLSSRGANQVTCPGGMVGSTSGIFMLATCESMVADLRSLGETVA